MGSFTSCVVFAGVAVFIGGLLAIGSQRAGQMGAPIAVVHAAAFGAGAMLLAAICLVGYGVGSLPDEDDPPPTPPG